MAVLIPPKPAHDSSNAENWLFRKLSQLSDEYCVLHSLGSMRHDHKSWSEIDFTVIGPEGVFFIEVKGGTVGRKDGEWIVTRGDGKEEKLGRGPFFQVGGAEASTRRFLQDRHPWVHEAVLGYWVVTPDCVLNVDDLGADSNALYDARNVNIGAKELVKNMREYWIRRKGKNSVLSADQVKAIQTSLCADVPMVKSIRKEVSEVEEKIHAATIEQERILSAAQSNMRLLITGPAGSGKSTVAVHEINRQVELGNLVLFVCSSANMAKKIRSQYVEIPNVDVYSTSDLIEASKANPKKYDALIIDEAQDFKSDEVYEVLDQMLLNGVSNGTWRMFSDPFQSVLFDERGLQTDFLDSGNPSVMNLQGSVRTTKQIAGTASALGYVDQIGGGIHGPEVEILYVSSEDIRIKVKEKLGQLADEGLLADEIMLVSLTEDPFWLAGELEGITQEYGVSKSRKIVNYSAANNVKGLESIAVILVGIAELESAWTRQQAYIASTRASTYLTLILDEGMRSEVQDAYIALAERHSLR
jgi:DNA replication protein DnaC